MILFEVSELFLFAVCRVILFEVCGFILVAVCGLFSLLCGLYCHCSVRIYFCLQYAESFYLQCADFSSL